MSWFSFKDLAKNALNEAQKTIDKALDIQGKDAAAGTTAQPHRDAASHVESASNSPESKTVRKADIPKKKQPRTAKAGGSGLKAKKLTGDVSDDFFAAWGDESLSGIKSPHSKPVFDEHDRPNHRNSSYTSTLSTSFQNDDEISKVLSDSDIEVIAQPKDLQLLPIESEESCHESLNLGQAKSSDSFVEVPLNDIDQTIQEDEPMQLQGYDSTANTINIQNELNNDSDSLGNTETLDESCSNAVCIDSNKIASHVSSSTYLYEPTEQELLPLHHISDNATCPNSLITTSQETDKSVIDGTSSNSTPVRDEQIRTPSPTRVTQNDGTSSEISRSMPSPQAHDETIDCQISSCQGVSGEGYPSEDQQSSVMDAPKQIEVTSDKVSQKDSLEHTTDGTGKSQSPIDKVDDLESSESSIKEISRNSYDKYSVLSEKAEVYEQQLLNLSQRNALLNEENDNLRSDIARVKEECEKEAQKEIEHLSESIKSYESNVKLLQEEKANLMKQLGVLKSQLASRMTHEQVQSAITEKEESIKGLMEEGEVLAKKHLQQSNLIKKLKSQAQEREAELKTVREKLSNFETENTSLKEKLKIAQGQGKEERETSMRISDAYEQRERETQILQEKLSQSEEKQRTLQVNLDGAYKEIGDLHKQIAEQESRVSTEWKEKEADIMRESDLEKKKIISEQEHQRQLLLIQIMELNNSISRAEATAGRKDEDHRQEIKELQQRIQESEGRNQDLSDNVTSATRPLLRQIENLHATHATQQRSWNALEKTLNHRLGEAQADLLSARESERLAQNLSIEAKSKAIAFEKQVENDRKMISRQEEEISSLHKELEEYKMEVKATAKELEDLKDTHKESIHKSRKERLFLENQLQMEKVRSEAERKKHIAQQEAYQREKDRLMWSRSEITSVSSNQVAETESVGSSSDAFHGTDTIERAASSSSLPGLAHQLSFEGGRAISMSNVLENLQTQVKLRDGEIAQLRGEINMLEKTRSSMAEEIVRLTNLNEDMDGVSEELQDTKLKLSDVESRYSAILTMYGEKEEENEELKMDLVDVKAMYRQQINDLLRGEAS